MRGLSPHGILEIVERRNEVGIAGDEYDAIVVGLDVVDERRKGTDLSGATV